ncbi:MAG: tyrosine-type recombinase/integrase [Gemmatimonadetes bacterium]|nr:tyrosine-type recombinase/integrase [Gemmatimonadota bacterium]
MTNTPKKPLPALQPVDDTGGVLKPEHVDSVVAAATESHAPKTLRSYRTAWNQFVGWCEEQGYESLPAAPETVAAYLAHRADAGLSRSALSIDRAAVRYNHEVAGLDPTGSAGVKRVMRGLRRRAAGTEQKQATGIRANDLGAIRATAMHPRTGPQGLRRESAETAAKRGRVDIALISTMRDALLRRSEAVALRWSDIEFRDDGTGRLTIRHSKTDQEGEGAVQFISKDSATALKAIRGDAEDDERVFGLRSGRAVSQRIAAAARAAGLKGRFSAHACRVGMALDLVAAGASVSAVQVAGRWASARMPATYARAELAGQGAVAQFYAAK